MLSEPEERLEKQEKEASKQRVHVLDANGKEVYVGTPKAGYVCLGEIIQTKGWKISPSAQAVFPKYLEEALAIVGANERGEPNWDRTGVEKPGDRNKALATLDGKKDYIPLWLELLLFEDEILSARHQIPRYLHRGEDGEIHATEEGFNLCKERILSALEGAKKSLSEGTPAWSSPEQFPEDLFFSVLRKGRPLLDGAGLNTLSKEQKEGFLEILKAVFAVLPTKITRLPRGYFLASQWVPGLSSEIEEVEGDWSETAIQGTNLLDVFSESTFFSSPTIREALLPMWDHTRWEDKPQGLIAKAPYMKRKELRYIIGGKDATGEVRGMHGEEAWAIVENLGLETGLLHIQFASFCMEGETPWAQFFGTNADNLIRLLRLDEKKRVNEEGKRVRLTRKDQIQELEKYLSSLRSIHLMIKVEEASGEKWETGSPEPLWDISIMKKKETSLFEDFSVTVDLNVNVRAGMWAMREQGNRTNPFYSTLSKRILAFDPYREDWAIKWSIYLACYGPNIRTFKVQKLLEIVLPQKEVQALGDPSSERRRRTDCATKLQEQLKVMESQGWTIEPSPEFTEAIQAGEGRSRRANNFMQSLLGSTVKIYPPSPSLQGKAPMALPLQEEPPVTGAIIRKARDMAGLSVRALASRIGISESYVRLIEGGKRSPSPETFAKLKSVLKI